MLGDYWLAVEDVTVSVNNSGSNASAARQRFYLCNRVEIYIVVWLRVVWTNSSRTRPIRRNWSWHEDQNLQVGDALEIKIIFSGDAIAFDPDLRIKSLSPTWKLRIRALILSCGSKLAYVTVTWQRSGSARGQDQNNVSRVCNGEPGLVNVQVEDPGTFEKGIYHATEPLIGWGLKTEEAIMLITLYNVNDRLRVNLTHNEAYEMSMYECGPWILFWNGLKFYFCYRP